MEPEEMRKEKKPNSLVLIIAIIVAFAAGFGVSLLVNKPENKEEQKQEEKKKEEKPSEPEKPEDKEEPEKPSEPAKSCSGKINATYEGGYNGPYGQFTINENVTVTLRTDGTIDAVYKDSEGSNGTYNIENGKLVVQWKPIYGPGDETTEVKYDVEKDCSRILWGDGEGVQYYVYAK